VAASTVLVNGSQLSHEKIADTITKLGVEGGLWYSRRCDFRRDTAGLGIREHSYPVGSQPQVLAPLGALCSKDDVTSSLMLS